MTRPKLVIFDCDGVLVDSEPMTLAMIRDDLASRGLSLTEAEADAHFTGGTMRLVGEKAATLGADIPPDWLERFYEKLYARLAAGCPPIPGVVDVLDRLDAAGIAYAVGSNGSPEKMRITLGQTPELWDRLKNSLYSAQILGRAKPDPAVYLAAARDAGLDPADCVVVDDSAPGCTAGVAAGMRTLGFAPGSDGLHLRAVGATPFHAMSDLPHLLDLP